MSAVSTIAPPDLPQECERLRREVGTLEAERRQLELKVRVLQQQLWGRKSERILPDTAAQPDLFSDPIAAPTPTPAPARTRSEAAARQPQPKGPKPLDPALPREIIAVPAPEPKELICPATQRPMQPGFVESLEVLARRPAVYFVKRYERTVFVSPAKTAPVYAPWPSDVLPRSRVHASVVAHIATAHYADHLPFYRIEQQLARTGIALPRNTQVSLMNQLDRLLQPLVEAMKADVLSGDHVLIDPTPVPMCDPQRPGRTREATLWAYRNLAGTVWFEHQTSKSPQHPDKVLKQANYRGLLQTDGATGLGSIGPPGQVTSLGCFAHLRRYFYNATQAGEVDAGPYLLAINRLFRLERLATYFELSESQRTTLRTRQSLPRFDRLVSQAQSAHALPKSLMGKALHYLLGQQAPLRRTLEHARAPLSTNAVERAIRPLKLGAKNWLFIGHPSAGPRLANLFTVVENCRQLGHDPEAYLIELLTHLADHPAKRINEWLPRAWQPGSTTAECVSGSDQSR